MHRPDDEDLIIIKKKKRQKDKETEPMDEKQIEYVVVESFLTILNREPTREEFNNYTEEIKKGLNKDDFRKKLIHSDEFKQTFKSKLLVNGIIM